MNTVTGADMRGGRKRGEILGSYNGRCYAIGPWVTTKLLEESRVSGKEGICDNLGKGI